MNESLYNSEKTTIAYLRKDNEFKDLNDFPPPVVGIDPNLIDWNTEKFVCWQPDELNDQEYNLILWCPKRLTLFRAQSFAFDFE